jgi:hypothetical protein
MKRDLCVMGLTLLLHGFSKIFAFTTCSTGLVDRENMGHGMASTELRFTLRRRILGSPLPLWALRNLEHDTFLPIPLSLHMCLKNLYEQSPLH